MLCKLPLIRKCNIPANHNEAIMITNIGPFHGGASTVLVIDDNPRTLQEVVDGFKEIVAVASFSSFGDLYLNLVSAKDPLVTSLKQQGVCCVALPLLIAQSDRNASADRSPKSIR